WRRANPFGALRLLRSHHQLWRLSTISFIGYIAHEALPIVFVVYTLHRYHWTPALNGITLMIVGACSVAVSTSTGWFVAKLGERMTLVLGLMFAVLGFALMGAAPTGTIYILAIPLICLWGIYSPAVQNLMTRRVSRAEQGELQGAIGSLRSIAMLIGPGIFTWTFASFITRWDVPGAPWYLAAAMMVLSLAVAIQTVRSADYAAAPVGESA
ncbi:MAG: MFS transporter, partial [Candidatus Eremiobacteraeota bacterium]|nr:MFS transporter [Candidatus Eremiobacteraeota bacterium]